MEVDETSADERESTMAYARRRKHLEEFLRSKQSGKYHKDLSIWADELGLCTRTAKQYLQRMVWRGLIEISGENWKWIGDRQVAETEVKPTPKESVSLNFESPTPFMDYVKRKKLVELRQKLRERKGYDSED